MKSAVVAGNGPSLAEIDYSLLPDDYDVFRCNQFYFEDKYFLGKKVKYAFLNFSVILEQYFTYKTLDINNEYSIENIVISRLAEASTDKKYQGFKYYFPDIKDGYDLYISKLELFNCFLKFNNLYKGNYITSGVYMVAVAVALGYKNIYIAGIDFYEDSNNSYVFNHKKSNLIKVFPKIKRLVKDSIHNKNFDIEALKFLEENYDVNIFSLCPKSNFSNYFPCAYSDIKDKSKEFVIVEKPYEAIKDILIPIERAYLITGYNISIFKRINSKARRYFKSLLNQLVSFIKF